MDERPEQIEQHIRHQRSELEDNFSELEEKVKGAFDWRTQFEERPGVMLGAAFVGGVLLAAILPSTSSITQRVTSRRRSFADSYDSYDNRDTAAISGNASEDRQSESKAYSAYASPQSRQASETWGNLKNAAIGLGVTRLTQLVEELVPGFSEHYKKAASGQPTTNFGNMPTPQETSWQKPNGGGTDYASHS
jgi:hypothetical protein